MTSRCLRIGVVAGEHSGDILGAKVISKLRERHSNLEIYGIGGPRMISLGVESLFPMERLSVMGIVEPLSRLPELLSIRSKLFKYFVKRSPDVFLGIDSPDFNLNLEGRLKGKGIPIAHLVSPSVWAWRSGRIKKVARCVDRLFCLLPFEPNYYVNHPIQAEFVGHPLADELVESSNRDNVRRFFGLSTHELVIAILPGSRMSEVGILGEIFWKTAELLQHQYSSIQFLVPAVDEKIFYQLSQQLKEYPELRIRLLNGQAHNAIKASNAVLLASGTATLEAALLLRPMIVAYKMAPVSWAFLSRMANTKFVSLPNILADLEVVPEFLQNNATPEILAKGLRKILDEQSTNQEDFFTQLKLRLRKDFALRCAEGIENMFVG